jgi:Flp pilus assembly protein TadG
MKVKAFAKRKNERGSILATSAVGMLSLLLAVGLGVDISRFYLVKTELQNAADAAALAACFQLNGKDGGIQAAITAATQTIKNNYDFNKTAVTIDKIEFSTSLNGGYVPAVAAEPQAANIRFVKVTTAQSPVGITFAAVVLGPTKNLAAEATAGYSVPLNEICNFLPISVIDYGTPITAPNTYTFRMQAGTAISPGNYQILSVAGNGGADARVGLAAGVDACAAPGAVYEVDTKTGVTAGAVRQGINTRFDDFQTSQVNPYDMPPDKNILENINYDTYANSYKTGSPWQSPNNTGVANRRVVYIPIVKIGEYDQGHNTVRFDRFGKFFLQNKVGSGSGGELVAEYIDDITLGIGHYNPNGGAGDSGLATPVLYK